MSYFLEVGQVWLYEDNYTPNEAVKIYYKITNIRHIINNKPKKLLKINLKQTEVAPRSYEATLKPLKSYKGDLSNFNDLSINKEIITSYYCAGFVTDSNWSLVYSKEHAKKEVTDLLLIFNECV